MSKMGMKSPEEEYEDEIKGLPVRKRRNILVGTPVVEGKNAIVKKVIQLDDESTRNNDKLSSVKNIFTTTIQTTENYIDNNSSNLKIDKKGVVEEIDNSQRNGKISNKDSTNQQVLMDKKGKSYLAKQVEIIRKHDTNKKKQDTSLLDHLVTLIGSQDVSHIAETTTGANLIKSDAKKIRIKARRKPFESKIVSSKYVSNNAAIRIEEKQPLSNQEILNSISVGLNEAGLLRNPSSSTFVKLLQATLTA